MSGAVYNEIEPFACGWLESLIDGHHIAPGRVERRSIADLQAADVRGDGQRHFFAGIGVWSAALREAGWPDEFPVWTGSCPCQPFSVAGRHGGKADARHLWPEWFRLIAECHPPIVFGEQVASRAGLAWLDDVLVDLEGAGYACAAADLCAAGVGAPHIRQRVFFVAYADGVARRLLAAKRQPQRAVSETAGRGGARGVALTAGKGRKDRGLRRPAVDDGAPRGLGDPRSDGDQQHARDLSQDETERAERAALGGDSPLCAGATRGFWSDAEWILCRDGLTRPIEPGTFPLAHGVAGRVGRLRGYGNALVLQAASTFIGCAAAAIEARA